MVDVRVVLDRLAIRKFEADPGTRADVLDVGRQVARRAAGFAPRRTGAGAGSIAPFPAPGQPGATDVSWSNRYPYMIFHEDGTSYVPGQHFLRDAFESYIH